MGFSVKSFGFKLIAWSALDLLCPLLVPHTYKAAHSHATKNAKIGG